MSNSLVSGNIVSLKSQPIQEQHNIIPYFKMITVFLPLLEEVLEVNSQKCWGAPLALGPTGAHKSQTKPLALSELQYRMSSYSTGSCRSFSLRASTLATCELLYQPARLSNFGVSRLPVT